LRGKIADCFPIFDPIVSLTDNNRTWAGETIMQVLRQVDNSAASLVGWGVHVMLLCPKEQGSSGRVAAQIAQFGGIVTAAHDTFEAIEAVSMDAGGYGLMVIDCDAFGGLDAGRRVQSLVQMSGFEIPTILISSECTEQIFPTEDREPVVLRAPISAVAARVAFEHSMRNRLVYAAA
jgi:hypothetical protein